MKTLCGVLALCLLSVCRAAPLTCDQLLSNSNDLELSGRWYAYALAMDSCLVPSMVKFTKPNVAVDFSSSGATNGYEMTFRLKTQMFCVNETESTLGKSFLLLPSCPDCIVMKDGSELLLLLSRKTTVDDAALGQFQTQAECFNLPPPTELLHSDYDFSNCTDMSKKMEKYKHGKMDEFTLEEVTMMTTHVQDFMVELGKCLSQNLWRWVQSKV